METGGKNNGRTSPALATSSHTASSSNSGYTARTPRHVLQAMIAAALPMAFRRLLPAQDVVSENNEGAVGEIGGDHDGDDRREHVVVGAAVAEKEHQLADAVVRDDHF